MSSIWSNENWNFLVDCIFSKRVSITNSLVFTNIEYDKAAYEMSLLARFFTNAVFVSIAALLFVFALWIANDMANSLESFFIKTIIIGFPYKKAKTIMRHHLKIAFHCCGDTYGKNRYGTFSIWPKILEENTLNTCFSTRL